MSRIDTLMDRYEAAKSLVANGAEIVAVADPAGARLNAALRRVMIAARDDPDLWDGIIAPAKLLRWRLATHLQADTGLASVTEIERQERRLRFAVADADLPTELASAARAAAEAQSPLADELLDMISQVGPGRCLLVAAGKPAQSALAGVWSEFGVRVLTAAQLAREETCSDHAYAIGPPRFFGAALVTAPAARSVSFLIPAWIHDRRLPTSSLTAYADSGAMFIPSHTRAVEADSAATIADPGEAEGAGADTDGLLDELFPQPAWQEPSAPSRSPGSDDVLAHKVLLDGGLAIWLDDGDGDRIRTLDPAAPSGERVQYAKLSTVRPGSYLLLRQGMSDHGALYDIALRLLGDQAAGIEASQRAWKKQLGHRIAERGDQQRVIADLRALGIQAASRVPAWVDPSLIRPHSDSDFRILLGWLQIPVEPSFANAKLLRRAHHQAGVDVREALEKAVEIADLTKLEHDGHLALRAKTAGFREMIATRVLSVSPHAEVTPRHHVRVLFKDRRALWLE